MADLQGSVQIVGTTDDDTQFIQVISQDSPLGLKCKQDVAPGVTGSLTTRTDANTGTVTMDDSGHGITTGDVVDLYWAGGSQRAVTVGTVSGTTVPIDLGTGDDLPDADTAVTLKVPEEFDFVVTGDNVELLCVKAPVPGTIVFADGSGDLSAAAYRITEENGGGRVWCSSLGTNPLASKSVVKVKMSHGAADVREMEAQAQFESS